MQRSYGHGIAKLRGGCAGPACSGEPDGLMDEIPTAVVDRLPQGLDQGFVVLNRPLRLPAVGAIARCVRPGALCAHGRAGLHLCPAAAALVRGPGMPASVLPICWQ